MSIDEAELTNENALRATCHPRTQSINANMSPFSVFSTSIRDSLSHLVASNPDIAVQKGGLFIPDYSVLIVTDCQFIVIKRSQYWAARRATLMEMEHRIESSEDFFTKEWNQAEKASIKDNSSKEVLGKDMESLSLVSGDDLEERYTCQEATREKTLWR